MICPFNSTISKCTVNNNLQFKFPMMDELELYMNVFCRNALVTQNCIAYQVIDLVDNIFQIQLHRVIYEVRYGLHVGTTFKYI